METNNLNELKEVISFFNIEGDVIDIVRYGEGHINVTYLVTTNKKQYILQRINNQIFPNVNGLMNNISLVTNYIKQKLSNNEKERKTLSIVKSKDNHDYIKYKDGYYRVYIFIYDSVCYQIVHSKEDFYKAAKSFGDFYKLLDGFDTSKLIEIIPNFHNTKIRYENFLKALKEDKLNRAKNCLKEIEFVKSREHYYSKIVDMLNHKEIPLKVTHNDTKLNNILFDKYTNNPLAVIDLDTIMPGTILYDFGDSIRFGCNPCLEDEKDLSKVNFQFHLYKAYLKGFLEALGDSITQKEKENLALSSIMMTIECGMRFLGDYLSGDTYFHINREGQNLDRARTQFKLIADMEKIFDKMNDLIK